MSSCNGCMLERLEKEYGDKLIKVEGAWYIKGEQPAPGQGTPIKFVAWFMSEGHDHSTSMAEESMEDW
jgi:hypothetical protein